MGLFACYRSVRLGRSWAWILLSALFTLGALAPAPARATVVVDNIVSYRVDTSDCLDGVGPACAAFGLTPTTGDIRGIFSVRESLLLQNLDAGGQIGQVIGLPANASSLIDFSFQFGDVTFTRNDIVGTIDFMYNVFLPDDLNIFFDAALADGTTLSVGLFTEVARGPLVADCFMCNWVFSDSQPAVFPVSEPPPWALMVPVIALFGLPVVRTIRPRLGRG